MAKIPECDIKYHTFSADKTLILIERELQQAVEAGQITTATEIASLFQGVKAAQVMHLVEVRFGSLLDWHAERGQWGTLLYPKGADVVELLQKSWVTARRESRRLEAKMAELLKQVQEARAVRGDKFLEEGAAEINELIRKEVA
jgi:hypothetical protein